MILQFSHNPYCIITEKNSTERKEGNKAVKMLDSKQTEEIMETLLSSMIQRPPAEERCNTLHARLKTSTRESPIFLIMRLMLNSIVHVRVYRLANVSIDERINERRSADRGRPRFEIDGDVPVSPKRSMTPSKIDLIFEDARPRGSSNFVS